VDKDFKLISGFAVSGLVVAALAFLCLNLDEFDAAILCPPLLLSFLFSDVMKDKGGLYVILSLIALLNSGLYAVVGAMIVGLRKRPRTKSD
jgi:hypothetical protein